MSAKMKVVRDYISELERTKDGRDPQVKQGLEIYIELWKRAIEKGVVGEGDAVDVALSKIESAGGLYKAVEG